MKLKLDTGKIVICALYKFTQLPNYKELQSPLLRIMESQHIKGSLLLAKEGINGTIAGTREAIDNILEFLNSNPSFHPIEYKESFATEQPFLRTKVKLKKEIVTMGVENIDPNHVTGTYVDSKEWNNLISDPDVLLVDTRNDYEVAVGTFTGAINPNTSCFREFPEYVNNNLNKTKHKKVAMFCTGGIRCEKSTAYLKQQGFDEVYHLKGGILKYLEDIPENESLWQGECYVFDQRVTVNHQLEKGNYDQCNACRRPITEADKESKLYIRGVSCPQCSNVSTDKQKQRFLEREKQMILAKKRGTYHMGDKVRETVEQARLTKKSIKEQNRIHSTENAQ